MKKLAMLAMALLLATALPCLAANDCVDLVTGEETNSIFSGSDAFVKFKSVEATAFVFADNNLDDIVVITWGDGKFDVKISEDHTMTEAAEQFFKFLQQYLGGYRIVPVTQEKGQ